MLCRIEYDSDEIQTFEAARLDGNDLTTQCRKPVETLNSEEDEFVDGSQATMSTMAGMAIFSSVVVGSGVSVVGAGSVATTSAVAGMSGSMMMIVGKLQFLAMKGNWDLEYPGLFVRFSTAMSWALLNPTNSLDWFAEKIESGDEFEKYNPPVVDAEGRIGGRELMTIDQVRQILSVNESVQFLVQLFIMSALILSLLAFWTLMAMVLFAWARMKYMKKLKQQAIGSFIMLFAVTYMALIFGAGKRIRLGREDPFSSTGGWVYDVAMAVVVLWGIGFPLAIGLAFLKTHSHRLDEEGFIAEFGSLYTNYHPKYAWMAVINLVSSYVEALVASMCTSSDRGQLSLIFLVHGIMFLAMIALRFVHKHRMARFEDLWNEFSPAISTLVAYSFLRSANSHENTQHFLIFWNFLNVFFGFIFAMYKAYLMIKAYTGAKAQQQIKPYDEKPAGEEDIGVADEDEGEGVLASWDAFSLGRSKGSGSALGGSFYSTPAVPGGGVSRPPAPPGTRSADIIPVENNGQVYCSREDNTWKKTGLDEIIAKFF